MVWGRIVVVLSATSVIAVRKRSGAVLTVELPTWIGICYTGLFTEVQVPCVVFLSMQCTTRTQIMDVIEYTLKQKWRWAGHIARMKDKHSRIHIETKVEMGWTYSKNEGQ